MTQQELKELKKKLGLPESYQTFTPINLTWEDTCEYDDMFSEVTMRMYNPVLTPENMAIVVSKIKPLVADMIIKEIKKDTDEEMRNHPEFGDLYKLLYPSHE